MSKTERMTLTEAERSLADIVDRVSSSDTRVVIERDGRPVAAIVPVAEAPLHAGAKISEMFGLGGEEGDRFADFMEQVVAERLTRPPREVNLADPDVEE